MCAFGTKHLFYIICCVLSQCVTTSTVYEDLDHFVQIFDSWHGITLKNSEKNYYYTSILKHATNWYEHSPLRYTIQDVTNLSDNTLGCVRVPYNEHRIELTSLHIDASLNDIILISVPEIHNPTIYYLTDPDGDTVPLDITSKTTRIEEIDISELETKYKILDVNFDDCINEVCNKTEGVDDDEFIIGPLSEYDHGNWVLSAYVMGNGGWMELYQVLTIQITEHIPINPTKPKLSPGETFELSLAYPIEDLESCEIVAPRTTFDRSFDRSRSNLDSCGFRISNITKKDEGVWKIIAVGRIVYESTVFLEVNNVF